MSRYFKVYGLVLKRVNFAEGDQIIHFLSQEKGHFSAVAKGVRKLNSKKLGLLEPGSLTEAYFVETKGLPLLTQLGQKQEQVNADDLDLKQMQLFFQLLEVFERLFVADELSQALFHKVIKLRKLSLTKPVKKNLIRTELGNLISELGFQHPKETQFQSLTAYLEALTEKELKSARFLTINK